MSPSGRPRVIINTNEPATVAQRFDTTGSQPANAQELQAGLVNRGAQMTAQPRDNFAQILTDFENQGAAAGQRTTPNIGAQSKNLISANVMEGDDGNAYYVDPASGQLLPTDSNKQVVLRDPADGRLKVFGRTDSTDEGVLSAAGRMLGTGLATGAPTNRVLGQIGEAAQAAPSPGNQVVEAAQRLGVGVPRAIASDSAAVQRIGQGIRNVPVVGDAIPRATQQLIDDLGGAVQRTAGEFGQGSGPNVANRIGNTLGSAAQRETAAAVDSARRTDEAAQTAFEQAQRTGAQALDTTDANALQAARQAVGDMSPQDMGQVITARLRAGEQAARARKEQLYNIAGNSGGAIHADAVSSMHGEVLRNLERDGLIIDPLLTPAANRMVAEIEKTAKLQALGGRAVRSSEAVPTAKAATAARSGSAATSDRDAPQSLLEFLASKGGLGPDSELEAIGASGHVVNVGGAGRRKLVRQGGLPLDYAREAAEEAGYLQGSHNGTSTVADLLDMIDAEMRGQKRYPYGSEGALSKRERIAMSEREQHEYDSHLQGIKDDLAAAGYKLNPSIKQRVIEEMSRGRSADDAVQNIIGELNQRDRAVYSANITGAPVDMQAIEQTRKKLGFLSRAATNDSDRRAARYVMSGFDDWLNNAFDNALFSGSDEALKAFKDARAANADWRTRFGFNARDDADRIVNRIATGEVTPQEVSNWLIGASKVGSKGVSSRLLTRIAEATGNDPEAMQAIRGGIWNRLSQSTGGVEAKTGAKVANDINEFLNGSGRVVANRLFTPEQRGIMSAYADTLRRTQEGREHLAEAGRITKPTSTEVGTGPMQELADTVLGRNGRTDEALFSAINSYAKSGSRGDVQTLARLVKAIPPQDRGDLAGAIIRQVGISPRTGQFSPDVFVSQWQTYTPQAKAILFGNAGAHRQALDDIMTISQRMKEVGSRFGNPSGTAQNRNIFAMGAGAMAAPLTTLTAAVGGGVAARILASPAGAASAAKWTRTYYALRVAPSAQRLAAFEMASRNLANTAGVNVTSQEFLRALQGPVPARAQDEQQ
jgi:hypothetical protein